MIKIRKGIQKSAAVILSAALLCCTVMPAAAAQSTESSAADRLSVSVYVEDPDITDGVVQLETASDIFWLSNQLSLGNVYDAALVNDIDLSGYDFMGIGYAGTDPEVYTGTFDGNGYTVTMEIGSSDSRTSYCGLFSSIGDGAVIKNVTLCGTVYGESYVAAAAGYSSGGTIENVTSYVVIDASGLCIGSMAGYGSAVNLFNCANYGTVTGARESVGGLIGNGDEVQIFGCSNYGTVSCDTYRAGGIAGRMAGDKALIAGSLNYADVTGTYDVGGILGYAAEAMQIKYCGNTGAVTGTYNVSGYYAGGILGRGSDAVTIESCYNSGTVTGTANAAPGGIAGNLYSSGASVVNCYNTGNVVAESAYYMGGIAASGNYLITITNCYVTGDVTYNGTLSSAYIGAILGYPTNSTGDLENISNNYALSGIGSTLIGHNETATDTNAQYITEDELKAAATAADGEETSLLGSAYKASDGSSNDGYPVLAWQDVTASEVSALIDAVDLSADDGADALMIAYAAYNTLSADERADVENYTDLSEAVNDYYEFLADVDAVIALIDAIGSVSLYLSGDAITAAREAYDALTENGKALVTNYDTLVEAESTFDALGAAAVIELIDAIGTVTLDSGDAIEEARFSYDELSENAQSLVTNLAVLTAAEKTYAALCAASAEALITAIGTVTIYSGDAIDAARSYYDALSETAQALVTNYDTLVEAESTYALLVADAELAEEVNSVIVLIKAIGTVTANSGSMITAARSAYDALSDEAKALVTNYDTLVEAESTYAAILSGDYTASADDDATYDVPATPSVKSVSNTASGVVITWSKVSGADSYYLYKKTGSGAYVLLTAVSSGTVSYTDRSVKNGTTYQYKVAAVESGTVSYVSSAKQTVWLSKAAIKSVKNKAGKKMTVTVKKNAKASGYQIVYSTSKNFKSKKTVTVKSAKQVKTVIKKLKKKKKYYVKVRSYKKSGSVKYYGAWSSVKSVKIKK